MIYNCYEFPLPPVVPRWNIVFDEKSGVIFFYFYQFLFIFIHQSTLGFSPPERNLIRLLVSLGPFERRKRSAVLEAARLRRSGAEWDAAFEEAGVEDTSPARQSVYRIIREAKDEAKARPRPRPPVLRGSLLIASFARPRTGPGPRQPRPRPGPNGAAREPPWAAEGWGRRRPDAPLWCGCCSSLTLTIGAAALSAA